MQQPTLLTQNALQQGLALEQVKASFVQLTDRVHEVILEVNSHKFLIRIKTGLQSLEKFEVLAVRGFVDLGVKFVTTLKKIVTALYFQV